jgi:23S rRNA pseudouridine1911/1915/1917 synthase
MTGTVMNALLWSARTWADGGRPSIVGRLDKLTSGIVVAAKRPGIHAAVQRALASGASEKEYLAIVYGRVSPARGRIDLALSRAAGDRRRVVPSAVGAASQTRYETLSRVRIARETLTLLRCRLMTGRMHQIRVHLSALGWPIVGDQKYGDPRRAEHAPPELRDMLNAFPRQALHAWRLRFRHPVTQANVAVEAPPPPDLDALARACGLDLNSWRVRRE